MTLTTDASDLAQPIYERMPIINLPDQHGLWLDPRVRHRIPSLHGVLIEVHRTIPNRPNFDFKIKISSPTTSAGAACAPASNAGSLRGLVKLGLERVGEVIFPDTSEPTAKWARVK